MVFYWFLKKKNFFFFFEKCVFVLLRGPMPFFKKIRYSFSGFCSFSVLSSKKYSGKWALSFSYLRGWWEQEEKKESPDYSCHFLFCAHKTHLFQVFLFDATQSLGCQCEDPFSNVQSLRSSFNKQKKKKKKSHFFFIFIQRRNSSPILGAALGALRQKTLHKDRTCSFLCRSFPPSPHKTQVASLDSQQYTQHLLSKRHLDSTPNQNPPKRRKLSDKDLLEAVRNGNTAAVRAALEKLSPGSKTETAAFEAVHEACRGNHNECLTLLLPYVETTQMGFGILLSECVHADHTACTEVLLQHWKSVCSNVSFVPHDSKDSAGQTSQLCPAMWEDPAVCQVFIGAGADIETENEKGRSPLHWASLSGALTTVKMLVKAGADVRATDARRATCLILAAYGGHTETVRYLVGLPELDLNHQGSRNHTALHYAVQRKHADVVQVLIDAGADIEAKDDTGSSPLHLASIEGELTTVKMLVEAGADVRATDTKRVTCLMLAAYYGHTDTVRYLVSLPELDLNHQGSKNDTALHSAVQRKHADVVQVLIDAGADIETKNVQGHSPLHLASISRELTTVKMLVKAGADVRATDTNRVTCLMFAAYYGHTDTVRYLVGLPEVDLNHQGGHNRTALHVAVQAKHGDVVQVLIDAGADIDTKDDDGRSPLHLASISGELTTMKMLVKAGADVRATDAETATCLMVAAYHGHTDTVRYLVSLQEVDLNHQQYRNKTALHFAVNKKHADVVQVLIDAGADIETRNDEGRSPLHLASLLGELTTVKMLVKPGADVRATDSERDTCLTLAAYNGHTDTVRYLVGLPEVDLNHQDSENHTARHVAVHEKHGGAH